LKRIQLSKFLLAQGVPVKPVLAPEA